MFVSSVIWGTGWFAYSETTGRYVGCVDDLVGSGDELKGRCKLEWEAGEVLDGDL